MAYNRFARLQYRFFAQMLRVVSPVKPLYRLALQLLAHSPKHVRGHILPVNALLGTPRLSAVSRTVLAQLLSQCTSQALMNECMCRTLGDCKDYPRGIGCLVLGEAVHRLHPALGREVTREKALAHVDEALNAGLSPMVIHMNGDALLWSLHYDKMLTVCFCCPCHCLVRKAVDSRHTEIAAGITALPGVSLSLDSEKCTGCGHCTAQCFTGAITVQAGKAVLDDKKCVACGRCAMTCRGALTVEIAEDIDTEPVLAIYKSRTGGVFTRQ